MKKTFILQGLYKVIFQRCKQTDTRPRINVGLTLAHCPRRWTNVKPTLIQSLVSAGVRLQSRDYRAVSGG